MTGLYHEGARELQDRFDTRRLADRLEEVKVHAAITPDDRAFIERMDMLFLATADAEGRPQCSYKGGDPGTTAIPAPSSSCASARATSSRADQAA